MTSIIYSYNNNGITNCNIGQFSIQGYSRAGIMTYFIIPSLNLVFDAGMMNPLASAQDNILISHGHMDHCGGIHTSHSSRLMNENDTMRQIIMPEQCIVPFQVISAAFSEMNRGRNTKNIKPLQNMLNTHVIESEKSLHNLVPLINTTRYFVKAHLMDHGITSYGYTIFLQSRKLKKEYHGLDGNAIKEIKKQIGNENLTDVCYQSVVSYTGDTTIAGVLAYPELLNAPILIMECTGFSPEDKKRTKEGKHIHWDELIEHHEKFMNNKIVLFHFSQQYKTMEDLQQYITSAPASLLEKIIFFL